MLTIPVANIGPANVLKINFIYAGYHSWALACRLPLIYA